MPERILMLCAGDIYVDWGAIYVGDLTFIKARADLTSNGNCHTSVHLFDNDQLKLLYARPSVG